MDIDELIKALNQLKLCVKGTPKIGKIDIYKCKDVENEEGYLLQLNGNSLEFTEKINGTGKIEMQVNDYSIDMFDNSIFYIPKENENENN